MQFTKIYVDRCTFSPLDNLDMQSSFKKCNSAFVKISEFYNSEMSIKKIILVAELEF